MDNGQKLSDIIGAKNRTKVKDLSTCGKVDGTVFHLTGIARTGRVNSPSVRAHLHRKRQYGVVTVGGGIDQHALRVLHPFRHFNTQQTHAVADNLGHIGGKNQSQGLFLRSVGVENAVVVIELIELFGQFIAVVGNATG